MAKYPKWSKMYTRKELEDLPKGQGLFKLYWITSDGKKLQYIGESKNIQTSTEWHLRQRWWHKVSFAQTTGMKKVERQELHAKLINRNEPPKN